MKGLLTVMILMVAFLAGPGSLQAAEGPVWPPPPAESRVVWVGEIDFSGLKMERGFFGGVARFLWGGADNEELALPFGLLVAEESLFLTCQDFTALVKVDPVEGTFRLFECEDLPMVSPVDMAKAGTTIYVSDSSRGVVYRLSNDELKPWVTEGLIRPTGLACSPDGRRVYVVDTGDHTLKVFDSEGAMVKTGPARGEGDEGLNFPTFAVEAPNGIWVNDTLNYRVKRFDWDGRLLASFGEEGSGQGAFARPKGLAVDGDGNIWVVDSLMDNIQIFDGDGRLLLVIGGRGRDKGEFWSPGGIAIEGDLVYVADTFNNRIQVLRYIGGGS